MNAVKTLKEAWDMAIGFLFRATPCMTAVAMLALMSAGTMTYFIIGNGNAEEGNIPLARAMETYGNWAVFAFDAEVIAIIALFYAVTRKFAKRNGYAKAFHVFMMILIASMSMLDLTNDTLLTIGRADLWSKAFSGAGTNPILKSMLWKDDGYSTFTRAVYNGTHLTDWVVECENGMQINSYPTPAMIYVGTSWTEKFPERAKVMRC